VASSNAHAAQKAGSARLFGLVRRRERHRFVTTAHRQRPNDGAAGDVLRRPLPV